MSISRTIIAGITVPNTALVKDVIDHAKSPSPPWLFNHVMRSWLFAAKLAAAEKVVIDEETLAIASIMHDIGLVPEYGSPDRRFEVDGAAAAVSFLRKHHEEESCVAADSPQFYKLKLREVLVWDAIALHTTPSLSDHSFAEVDLCQRGVAIDFRGRGIECLPNSTETINAVLEAFPRLGMKDDFKEILCAIARRKPETTCDNFVGAFGEAYVEGYDRSKGGDERMLAGLQDNVLET